MVEGVKVHRFSTRDELRTSPHAGSRAYRCDADGGVNARCSKKDRLEILRSLPQLVKSEDQCIAVEEEQHVQVLKQAGFQVVL